MAQDGESSSRAEPGAGPVKGASDRTPKESVEAHDRFARNERGRAEDDPGPLTAGRCSSADPPAGWLPRSRALVGRAGRWLRRPLGEGPAARGPPQVGARADPGTSRTVSRAGG